MEEENQQQVQQEPQQVKQEPQRVTMKDPKKVEVGKWLAALNHKKREAKKREEQAQLERGFTSGVNQYYGIGAGFSHAFSAIVDVGVIGGLGYYIYRTKKGEVPNRALQAPAPPQQPWGHTATPGPQGPRPQTNKFDMDYISSLL